MHIAKRSPNMTRQMSWLSALGSDGEKILHLRLEPNQPWKPYYACLQFAVPDYPVPRGSKGWATYQKLMKAGWELVPSAEARQTELVAR
jgi:hypothetical protein